MVLRKEFVQVCFLNKWIQGEKLPGMGILVLNWNMLTQSQKTVLKFLGRGVLCLSAYPYILSELMKSEGSFGKTQISSKALFSP